MEEIVTVGSIFAELSTVEVDGSVTVTLRVTVDRSGWNKLRASKAGSQLYEAATGALLASVERSRQTGKMPVPWPTTNLPGAVGGSTIKGVDS